MENLAWTRAGVWNMHSKIFIVVETLLEGGRRKKLVRGLGGPLRNGFANEIWLMTFIADGGQVSSSSAL
jgi:hypothetical protein